MIDGNPNPMAGRAGYLGVMPNPVNLTPEANLGPLTILPDPVKLRVGLVQRAKLLLAARRHRLAPERVTGVYFVPQRDAMGVVIQTSKGRRVGCAVETPWLRKINEPSFDRLAAFINAALTDFDRTAARWGEPK